MQAINILKGFTENAQTFSLVRLTSVLAKVYVEANRQVESEAAAVKAATGKEQEVDVEDLMNKLDEMLAAVPKTESPQQLEQLSDVIGLAYAVLCGPSQCAVSDTQNQLLHGAIKVAPFLASDPEQLDMNKRYTPQAAQQFLRDLGSVERSSPIKGATQVAASFFGGSTETGETSCSSSEESSLKGGNDQDSDGRNSPGVETNSSVDVVVDAAEERQHRSCILL